MIAKVYPNNKNIENMPLIPMRGVVVFPETVNHFDVGRKKTFSAVEAALSAGSPIFMVSQRNISVNDPAITDLYHFGVVGEVKQVLRFSDTLAKVLVECKYRAKLLDIREENEYFTADIVRAPVRNVRAADIDNADALVRSIRDQMDAYVEFFPRLSAELIQSAYNNSGYHSFVENLAINLPLEFTEKQSILEESSVLKRLQLLLSTLIRENNVLGIEHEINERVREQMNNNQRDYYLREQMRVISSELGDDGDVDKEISDYNERIDALPVENAHQEKLKKEASRLLSMPGNSQEAAVIRNYLDTVLGLPWTILTADNFDLAKAEKILNRDHYGLTDVKERMLEFLAVKSLTDEINAQIICLLGPPGVGKTSIAKAVAECMERKFVRMSLGGVRDEAEIRGHRRTYVGAMPGRIINAIQQAGTANPLILLDEVDKLGNDYRGDPSSALLEVLDPEQNNNFRDHYLDIPFDLSKVLFLTTANTRGSIPAPLYDRMDVIELSSYTREEKFKIAKLHLLSKQLRKHGLNKKQFTITDAALMSVIDNYTREAGVRSLERQLAKLIRKSAKRIVSKNAETVRVDGSSLLALLGPKLAKASIASHTNKVGVANGLAWTAYGGELMPIEVVVHKGTGRLDLTGSLGDVMKESAKIALSYIRSLPDYYGIPNNILSEYDIHIHAPEGAVPKDGPSAGITLTTALVSAVSGFAVKKDLAMTGEVTLKGDVLPIGGLKEKLIAAYKEKMKTVIIPKDNVPDLHEVSDDVKSAFLILPVMSIDEVLKEALVIPVSGKGAQAIIPLKEKPQKNAGLSS